MRTHRVVQIVDRALDESCLSRRWGSPHSRPVPRGHLLFFGALRRPGSWRRKIFQLSINAPVFQTLIHAAHIRTTSSICVRNRFSSRLPGNEHGGGSAPLLRRNRLDGRGEGSPTERCPRITSPAQHAQHHSSAAADHLTRTTQPRWSRTRSSAEVQGYWSCGPLVTFSIHGSSSLKAITVRHHYTREAPGLLLASAYARSQPDHTRSLTRAVSLHPRSPRDQERQRTADI